jgi:hypothetical protein
MKNKLYIYTTKTYREKGWYKFGETEREVEIRVKEQDNASNPEDLEIIYEIETDLSDKKIHKLLELKGHSKTRDKKGNEWYDSFESDEHAKLIINKILSEQSEDNRTQYSPRIFQTYTKLLFLEKLKNNTKNLINFILNFAQRFGKTIWSIDLLKDLYDNFGYKICVLPSYYLTSLTSFENDFYKFKGYSEEMILIDLSDEDLHELVEENYGKKLIIVKASLHTEDFEKKLSFLKEIPSNEKITLIDEADFGTHTNNCQKKINFIGAKLNLYMTGTGIEKLVNKLENLDDNIISWSINDMLMTKKGEHPIQKFMK